jgi:hypothetical protein
MAKRKGKEIGPLFGVKIDGDRKNFVGSAANAKELEAAAIAGGHKAVIFKHSDAEMKSYRATKAKDEFLHLGMQYYIVARLSPSRRSCCTIATWWSQACDQKAAAAIARHG